MADSLFDNIIYKCTRIEAGFVPAGCIPCLQVLDRRIHRILKHL